MPAPSDNDSRKARFVVAALALVLVAGCGVSVVGATAARNKANRIAAADTPAARAQSELVDFAREAASRDYRGWTVVGARTLRIGKGPRVRVIALSRKQPRLTLEVTYERTPDGAWRSTDWVLARDAAWARHAESLLATVDRLCASGRGLRIVRTRAPRGGSPLAIDVALAASGGRENESSVTYHRASDTWTCELIDPVELPQVGPRVGADTSRAIGALMRAEYPEWRVLSVRTPAAPDAGAPRSCVVALERPASGLRVRVAVERAKSGTWTCGEPVLAASGRLHSGASAFEALLRARSAGATETPVTISTGKAGALHITYESPRGARESWLAYDTSSHRWLELAPR